jgi:hypothetical protein
VTLGLQPFRHAANPIQVRGGAMSKVEPTIFIPLQPGEDLTWQLVVARKV